MPDRGGIAGRGDTCRIVVDQIAVGIAARCRLPTRSRLNSPACGVSTAARRSPSHQPSIEASERSASASSTSGGRSSPPGSMQHPNELGGRETGSQARADRPVRRGRGRGSVRGTGSGSSSSTSSSGNAIVVASTTFAANNGWSVSGTASVTRPDTGATGGAAHEQRGPGVVERSGEHEQLAERALVAALPGASAGARSPSPRRASARPPARVARRSQPGSPGPTPSARRPNPTGRALSHRFASPASGASDASAAAPLVSARSRSRSMRGEDPPLAVVESILDVGREEVAAARRPEAEGHRHRVVRLVADRHGDAAHAELLGADLGSPVEAHGRLAGRQALDLDIPPADAADAEPEHLRDGFLGCPAAGHRLGSIADVALLGRGQDTSSEARAEALERRADPFDLDDVDAELGDASEGGSSAVDAGPFTGRGHGLFHRDRFREVAWLVDVRARARSRRGTRTAGAG